MGGAIWSPTNRSNCFGAKGGWEWRFLNQFIPILPGWCLKSFSFGPCVQFPSFKELMIMNFFLGMKGGPVSGTSWAGFQQSWGYCTRRVGVQKTIQLRAETLASWCWSPERILASSMITFFFLPQKLFGWYRIFILIGFPFQTTLPRIMLVKPFGIFLVKHGQTNSQTQYQYQYQFLLLKMGQLMVILLQDPLKLRAMMMVMVVS